jgi:shikimate dehydrogenase
MSGAVPYGEVIGDPIDHSLSPVIHTFWIEKLGLRADYRRQRIDRAGLPAYLQSRRSDPAWRGCNVSMPL